MANMISGKGINVSIDLSQIHKQKGEESANVLSKSFDRDSNKIINSDDGYNKKQLEGFVFFVKNMPDIETVQNQDVGKFLAELGDTYEIKHSNGLKTTAVMLTIDKIRKFGIDLDTVFNGLEKTEYDVCNGILVDLDLPQIQRLLDAIKQKKPELKDLGAYNLRASKDVCNVLDRKNITITKNVWWFWTGEEYSKKYKDEEQLYPEPSVISNIDVNNNGRYCNSFIGNGGWDDCNPSGHFNYGAVVLGVPQ